MGFPLSTGTVTQCTQYEPIHLHISSVHYERISLYITVPPKQPLILGLPWIQVHNPWISWPEREITKWSEYCFQHCLSHPCLTIASISVESPGQHSSMYIPEEYSEFMDVFSRVKASGLPPHSPYNCAVNLLPGTTPPCKFILCPSLSRRQ